MDEQKKFSAIRVTKENVGIFQDVKFVVESVRFRKMSNDDLHAELINTFLSAHPEIEDAYKRMLAQREPAAVPKEKTESPGENTTVDE